MPKCKIKTKLVSIDVDEDDHQKMFELADGIRERQGLSDDEILSPQSMYHHAVEALEMEMTREVKEPQEVSYETLN